MKNGITYYFFFIILSLDEQGNTQPDRAQNFDAWGRRHNHETWAYEGAKKSPLLFWGYTGHSLPRYLFGEHYDEFNLINMNGRCYAPLLGSFLSPDNYVQMPDFTQNFNRYAYCLNNPTKYVDPSGELVWFVPIIIGAAIGGFSGYMMGEAAGAKGLNMAGYIAGGALIGGLSGGAAAGVSALGGGAMLAGATAGTIVGAGFSGLATGFKDGNAILEGALYGGLSGFIGGGVGAYIGGGWGALAGGVAANLTNQLLYNDGDINEINWGSAALSGAISLGMYHTIAYSNWKWGGGNKFGEVDLTYRAYNKLNATFTRSRFLGQERGCWIDNDGNYIKLKGAEYNSHSMNTKNVKIPENAKYLVHTHWQSESKIYSMGGKNFRVSPYEPSAFTDGKGNYWGDNVVIGKYNVDGMILTNKSLLYFNQTHYNNQWDYPLFRYTPLYFWE